MDVFKWYIGEIEGKAVDKEKYTKDPDGQYDLVQEGIWTEILILNTLDFWSILTPN